MPELTLLILSIVALLILRRSHPKRQHISDYTMEQVSILAAAVADLKRDKLERMI